MSDQPQPQHQEIFPGILDNIVARLGYRAAMVWLLDPDRQILELKHCCGIDGASVPQRAVEPCMSGIDGRVLAGELVALENAGTETSPAYSRIALDAGLKGMLAIPLRMRSRVAGVLRVYSAEARTFNSEEQRFWAEIATLCSKAEQSNRCFEIFHRTAGRLNSSLNLDSVLKTLLYDSLAELRLSAGTIHLLGARGTVLRLAAVSGFDPGCLKAEIRVGDSPLDQDALRQSAPVRVTGFQAGAEFEKIPAGAMKSVLLLPLRIRESRLGIMRLYSEAPEQFGPEEIRLVSAFAEIGAIAIENARLHRTLEERVDAMKETVDGWYQYLGLS